MTQSLTKTYENSLWLIAPLKAQYSVDIFHYLVWLFTTNLQFILRACSKLLYVYKPIGQWLQGRTYCWIENNEYAKQSKKSLHYMAFYELQQPQS